MLLAIDIGNSNIVWGVWNGETWLHRRIETHPVEAERFSENLKNLLDEEKLNRKKISSSVISSVVPKATPPVFDTVKSRLSIKSMIVDATFDTGIIIETDHPEKVGTDLIADAAGAYELIRDTCIVVDFGTATTVMLVKKPGELKGVSICVGLEASKETLTGKAAQLFDVPLQFPHSILGKNTTEAMQSGLVLGHLSMVEGIVHRIKKESGTAKVVATGGFSELLASHTTVFDRVEPLLTLDGLRLIAERALMDE